MTNCEDYQKQIEDLVSGMVSSAKKESLIRHLRTCASCNIHLKAERQLETVLRSHSFEFISPNFTDTVLRRHRSERLARNSLKGSTLLGACYGISAVVVVFAIMEFMAALRVSGFVLIAPVIRYVALLPERLEGVVMSNGFELSAIASLFVLSWGLYMHFSEESFS